MGRVEGKVAIITGAASGLGAAYAAALAAEGATVMLADVDEAKGIAQAGKCRGSVFQVLDVRDERRWKELIEETVARFGRLDILINNAGVVRYANIEDCELDDYRFINAVSAEGTFLGCKHAIPAMTRGGGGSIVNTASVAAIRGRALVPAYSAAKGAVVGLTLSIAAHCLERRNNVRCNAILPGAHETAMAVAARNLLPDDVKSGLEQVKRGPALGRPEDAARVVLFLASDESRSVTGTTVVIDNGENVS